MNRLHMLFIAVAMAMTSATAVAQDVQKIYIPFAFTANHQLVPAGFYKVDLMSDRFLALVNEKTGKTEKVLMVRPEIASVPSARSGFVFYVSGKRYYLKEVKIAGSSMRSELAIQPTIERKIAKNEKPATVEIAMNSK